MTKAHLTLIMMLTFVVTFGATAKAQTLGYAEAVGQLAVSCGPDIDKFCKKLSLGGGRILQCLNQNQAGVSAECKSSIANVSFLVQKRATARAAVRRICDADIRRFCGGIQGGDGNLLECFKKVKSNVSRACLSVVVDAGYDASVGAAPVAGQINLDFDQMQGNLAQTTIAIPFDFGSAKLRTQSFRGVGLLADSLYHPLLLGYRFRIVGNTDAKGSREFNFKLSQQRAAAIREVLINPFGINPRRIEAVGFGEEMLLNRNDPNAAENRNVLLINIGPCGGNC
jgi:OOP family OmpA-OmpF porin